MDCLHKEYERTRSFSRGAKTSGGKEPTWLKIPIVLKIPQRLKSSDKDRHLEAQTVGKSRYRVSRPPFYAVLWEIERRFAVVPRVNMPVDADAF